MDPLPHERLAKIVTILVHKRHNAAPAWLAWFRLVLWEDGHE